MSVSYNHIFNVVDQVERDISLSSIEFRRKKDTSILPELTGRIMERHEASIFESNPDRISSADFVTHLFMALWRTRRDRDISLDDIQIMLEVVVGVMMEADNAEAH